MCGSVFVPFEVLGVSLEGVIYIVGNILFSTACPQPPSADVSGVKRVKRYDGGSKPKALCEEGK